MTRTRQIAASIAQGITTGPLTAESVARVFQRVLGRNYRFVPEVLDRLLAPLGHAVRVRQYRVQRLLLNDDGFIQGCLGHVFPRLHLEAYHQAEPEMMPAPGAACQWQVPAIVTPGDLAGWLGVDMPRLLWLADARTTEARMPEGPLRRYHYRWIIKSHGGARLIESPKPLLKALQRRILTGILNHIPPHPAAHGFRRGRSIVSFAVPHLQQSMVLRMDLADFFPSLPRWRARAIFMTAGYPEPVATLLANLCVNTTPTQVLLECPAALGIGQRWSLKKRYQTPHLTQGSPASPALSNLCAYRLDLRLSGLAKAAGVNYTRYADDLVFSGGGDFARHAERFHHQVLTIAIAEGFEPHLRKTRFMPRSTAQRAAGILLNEKPNTSRKEYEVLKAILHHCTTQGPESQNRADHPEFQAHLAGRIAHIRQVNPARGEKLASLFQLIDWSGNPGMTASLES